MHAHTLTAASDMDVRDTAENRSRAETLMNRARSFYLGALVLLLVLPSPVSWMPSAVLKVTVFSLMLAISAFLFGLAGGFRRIMAMPRRGAVLTCGLLPAVYLLSALVSHNRSLALIGLGGDADTVFTAVLGFIALLLGFGLFSGVRARRLVSTFFWTIVGAVLAQYLVVLLGTHAFPQLLPNATLNLVGKWNDLGILAAVGASLSLIASNVVGRRMLAGIGGLLCLGIMVLVNLPLGWWLLLAGSFIAFFNAWVHRRAAVREGTHARSHGLWLSAAGALVSIVFIVWGTALSAPASSALGISALEVRPSLATTYQVARSIEGSSPARVLLGTGPATFTQAWYTAKPMVINLTPFWSVDFAVGWSVLATALVTVGVLGVLAWLLPAYFGLAELVRQLRRPRGHAAVLALASTSVLLWVALVCYAASQNIVLATLALTGVLLGAAAGERSNEAEPGHAARAISTVLVILLVAAAVILALFMLRRALSQSYALRAGDMLAAGDIRGAALTDLTSEKLERTNANLDLGVEIDLAGMKTLAAASTSPDQADALRSQFVGLLQDAVSQGKLSASLNPGDYQSYLELAKIYTFLLPYKVPGAYDSAVAAYTQAMQLDPTNPAIPLGLAQTMATQDLNGNLKSVQTYAARSLALKSDYTDTYLFIVQAAGAMNDLPTATLAAQAAVASQPGEPSNWFELGLLEYTQNKNTDAIAALEQAVKLQPDYANAKYFLGLAYHRVGRATDAVAQFEDLARTNPDSQEVQFILSNLQAGKDPFANATPPITAHPEKRATAPLGN